MHKWWHCQGDKLVEAACLLHGDLETAPHNIFTVYFHCLCLHAVCLALP